MKTVSLLLTFLLTALPAFAGEESLASRPGYVDFSALSGDYGEPTVMIDLSSSLLKLVSNLKHDDPVAAEALRNLESVRVHVYETGGDTTPASARMDAVSASLQGLDWEQIVRVRKPDEHVDIYVKHGDNLIHGVTVMAVDGEEAVFINVLGDIDPQQIGNVVAQIDGDFDLDLDVHGAAEVRAP